MANAIPGPLYHREWHGKHCIRGWVSLSSGLDRFGKYRHPPNGIRSPYRPVRPIDMSQSVWEVTQRTCLKNNQVFFLMMLIEARLIRLDWTRLGLAPHGNVPFKNSPAHAQIYTLSRIISALQDIRLSHPWMLKKNLLTYSMEQSPSWEANWFCS